MQLAKEGRIILDSDDVVETNYVSFQIKELCAIQFGSLEPVVPLKHGLLSAGIQERSFPVTFFDRTIVNMTSYFEVEEETDEEGGSKDNCPGKTNMTVAALEAMPKRLNLLHIFSLLNSEAAGKHAKKVRKNERKKKELAEMRKKG